MSIHWGWTIAGVFITLWAFGAYNRLMRERAATIRAFGALALSIEERAAVLLGMSHNQLLHSAQPQAEAAWHRLENALQQAANATASAQIKPLEPDRMGALGAALSALNAAYEDIHAQAQDLAGAPWPPEVHAQLARCDARLLTQTEHFDAQVAQYNESIDQFPALLIAWLFGMKAARGLRTVA